MPRPIVTLLASLALASPLAARAAIVPRVAAGMVIEDGPAGSGATAVGPALTVGLALGAPWLSLVADLGFRQAWAASSGLEGGWTEYSTRDTVLTLGLHSELEVRDRWLAGGEFHVGRVSPDYRASAEWPVYAGDGGVNVLYGGAVEASYLVTPHVSLGLRFGADRFERIFYGDDLVDHGYELDARRTSYTVGLLAGFR